MATCREFVEASQNAVPVRGFLHRPSSGDGDCLIVTHGAGANCDSPLLMALADAFCIAGLIVLRCNLPFRQKRPHGPPPRSSAQHDQEGLRATVASMRREFAGRVFLGGHSYGGRQASILSATEPGLIDRLLLLSYPLHPPQRPNELRTGHFPQLQTPTFFVHGTHDGFGSIDEMSAALTLIPAPTELLRVSSAGHELMNKRNRDDLPKIVVEAFRTFGERIAVPRKA